MSCNTHIVPAVKISVLMLYYMFYCYESRTFWSTLQKTNTGFLEQVLQFTVNLVTLSGSKGVMAASESQLFSRWMDSAKRWHYNALLTIAVHSKMCEGFVSKAFFFASNRLENHLLVNKWTWMKIVNAFSENSHSKDEGPIPSSVPNGDVRSLSLAKEKKPAYSNVMRRPGKQPNPPSPKQRRIQSPETLRNSAMDMKNILGLWLEGNHYLLSSKDIPCGSFNIF